MEATATTAQTTPPGNSWFTIWLKPRGTIRWIVETNPKQQVILLAVLGGIAQLLSTTTSNRVVVTY